MKKILLSVIVMVAFIDVASSQSTQFGIKAGVNFARLGADADDAAGVTSFYAGGLADITISENFHVQPEILYSSEGAEGAEFSLVRVPIMAKFYIGKRFNLQAGPSINVKLMVDEEEVDDILKRVDYGLALGAAYELPGGLFCDVRYNFSLTSVSDTDEMDILINTLQLGLGYRF